MGNAEIVPILNKPNLAQIVVHLGQHWNGQSKIESSI